MKPTIRISTDGKGKYLLAFGVCLFLSAASFAQGERERTIQDLPKSSDSTGHYEGPESTFTDRDGVNKVGNNPVKEAKTPSQNVVVKKENTLFKQGGEKDAKKEGMSTLSFNLFLYIVDKFKED